MKSIFLKQAREKIRLAQKAITDVAYTRTGANQQRMTESEAVEWQKLEADYNALSEEIKIAEITESREAKDIITTETHERKVLNEEKPKFRHFGEFLRAVKNVETRKEVDPRLETRATSGQNTLDPSEGGFLVGSDYMKIISEEIFKASILAPLVKKYPISTSSNRATWTKIKNFGSRVTGSRYGGVRAYWLNEADQYTASKIQLEQGELKLSKIGAFGYATDEQLEDGLSIESFLSENVALETAFLIDEGIFSGTGAGQMLGITNSPGMVTITKEAGQPADTIVYENILKMRNRLLATSRKNSYWLINQDCEPQLQTMALVVGAGGVPVYLPAAGVSVDSYDTLFGRPVMLCEHSKTIGDKFDIVLFDPSYYMLINKGETKKYLSMHVRFDYGEMAYRFTTRINGMPTFEKPITAKEGSSTYSPYICLEARA